MQEHEQNNKFTTMSAIPNYHRFYASLKRLQDTGDKEELKETLVSSFTNGRTTSLREMSVKEYETMCISLEEQTGWKIELKKKRSLCLKLMQLAGIDTTDWQRINDFCRHPKIAGKVFARLNVADLDVLQTKLRSIIRKGGLKPKPARDEHRNTTSFVYIPMSNIAES